MQESKSIDTKLSLAIQELQEAASKKIENAKYLQKQVTALSIENIKLKDTIAILMQKLEASSTSLPSSLKESKKLEVSGELPFQNVEEDQLLSKGSSEHIDISISQLKKLIGKNPK
ncbi:hypothetical protein [Candidatus Bandiella euplotis]|uniref:Uncharacterized protein n=1 Tax=Candidatus Bandiella euplotis TaxID=1664265 RepID=A0ABZ0UK22_9RICK|nr:hypothetical protein [Candidatus Bandiella woodruffii]WPX96459.1 hypothetical protein Bandiella_00573 [Candidatus Bandiella woodruffii]